MTATKVLELEQHEISEGNLVPLAPRWITQPSQVSQAAASEDAAAVWIITTRDLADQIIRQISWPSQRAGYAILIGPPRPEILPALEDRFVRVVFVDPGGVLPKKELEAVLKSPERRDRFIGGIVDKNARIVTPWRGNLDAMVVPFSALPATANRIRPHWNDFSVADYGHTVRFGDYEAAADSILYDFDPDFRRRQNTLRRATERSLGASIRRLRKQRQLTRNDFKGLDPKTLARIERSEVENPHRETLLLIANRLGVKPDELGSY